MKRTTETLAAAAAAALMAASCTESYPGLDYVPDQSHVIKNTEDVTRDSTPILVFATEQDFFSVTTRSGETPTRGTGTFISDSALYRLKYANSTFHVLAFRNAAYGDTYPELAAEADLTLTACSDMKPGKKDPDNTSCLLDGTDYWAGAEFRFNPDMSGGFEPRDGKARYYSGTYQDVGYNFFVYHIDDFKPTEANTRRNPEGISYDFEVDGTRDLMFGSAPPVTDSLLQADYSSLNLTDKEKTNIRKGKGGYSTYTGHRNLHPTVKLNHKLCRLMFYAYPGDSSANRTTIDSISVVSLYKGTLTVAGRTPGDIGVEWDGTKSREVFLSDAAADTLNTATGELNSYPGRLREGGYRMEWRDEYRNLDLTLRPKTQIGAGMMLPPADNFVLYIYSTFTKADGERVAYRSKYILYAPEARRQDGTYTHRFDEGIFYNIRIAVYGLQQIQISVSDTRWLDGGTIDIDPDDAVYN